MSAAAAPTDPRVRDFLDRLAEALVQRVLAQIAACDPTAAGGQHRSYAEMD